MQIPRERTTCVSCAAEWIIYAHKTSSLLRTIQESAEEKCIKIPWICWHKASVPSGANTEPEPINTALNRQLIAGLKRKRKSDCGERELKLKSRLLMRSEDPRASVTPVKSETANTHTDNEVKQERCIMGVCDDWRLMRISTSSRFS